jgi:hypothetical protein
VRREDAALPYHGSPRRQSRDEAIKATDINKKQKYMT